MRPLHLQIRGIGPFAEEENVPFDRLSENGLYLITGDTGAGKTTIFDAICFALFGEVSGDVRESGTLRSDYAKLEQDSQVTFRFEQGGREYVVTRNPAYDRPKLKGKGIVKQLAGAQLTLPDGVVVDGEREVTRRVEGILGLDRNQFKQMAMIAQGEFLKLLLANTKDRSAIFRKIFGTGLYSDLQERLRQEAAEWKKRCEETERSIRQYLGEIQLEPEGEERCPQTQQLRQIVGSASLDEAQQIPVLLEEWLTAERVYLAEQEEEAARQEQLGQTVTEALTRVIQENQHKRKLAEVRLSYERHKEQEVAQQKEQQFLERADRVEQGCRPLWKSLQDAKVTLSRQESMLQDKQRRKMVLDEKLPALKAAREESLATEAQRQRAREQLTIRKTELPGRKRTFQQRQQLERQRLQEERQVNEWERSYLRQEENYRQKATVYMQLQQMFLRQQAGVLASRLQTGEPCPVCGSREHPAPAHADGQVVEETQVQQAQDAMNQAQEQLRTLGAELQSKRTLVEQLTRQWETLGEQLEGWDAQRIREEENTIRQTDQQLYEQEQQAQRAIREYEECQQALLPLEGELENQVAQVQEAALALKQAEESWQAALAVEQLTDEQEYANYILNAAEKKRRKDACQNYRESGVRLLASLDTQHKIVEDAEKIRQERGYERLVESAGQPMTSEELESALREKSQSLMVNRNQAERTRSALRQRIVANERIGTQLHRLMTKRQQQMAQWELYADLDRTAGGNLKGKERLALEQYVQAFYFDQIVERANRRFHEMSGGRYQLGRRQEGSNRRSMVGLELEVMDYYTGKCRPVASLSGGEAFQASLSLALGMSDVVQSTAGGIRIEAMFVDEGFGSLDREAMDLAISTLKGLAEENFLVGIISHVEELKERIEQKILVEKGPNGSHIHLE